MRSRREACINHIQCAPATPEHACMGICTRSSPAVRATGGGLPLHKTLHSVRPQIKPLNGASPSQGIPRFTLSRPLPAPRPDGHTCGTCTSVHTRPTAGAVHSGKVHLHPRQQHRRASSGQAQAFTGHGRPSEHVRRTCTCRRPHDRQQTRLWVVVDGTLSHCRASKHAGRTCTSPIRLTRSAAAPPA